MINFEKIKQDKRQSLPFLRRPAPASYFHSLFLIFQSHPPPSPEIIKIYSLPFKTGGGGGPNYETLLLCLKNCQFYIRNFMLHTNIQIIFIKSLSVLSTLFRLIDLDLRC